MPFRTILWPAFAGNGNSSSATSREGTLSGDYSMKRIWNKLVGLAKEFKKSKGTPRAGIRARLGVENLEQRELLSSALAASDNFVWRLVDVQVDQNHSSKRYDYGSLGYEELNLTKDSAYYHRVVNQYGQNLRLNIGFQNQLENEIKPNERFEVRVNANLSGTELRDFSSETDRYRGFVSLYVAGQGYQQPQLDHRIVGVDKSYPTESVTFTFTAPKLGDKFYLSEEIAGITIPGYSVTVTTYTFQKFAVAPVKRPAAPRLVAKAISTNQVELSWNSVAGVDSYSVWKRDGRQKMLLGNVSGTSFVVGNLTPGVTGYYSVTAVNAAGSASSAWVAGTPARAELVGNELVVYGTDRADQIYVGQTNDRISINRLPILVNGKFVKDVYAGLVGHIRVDGKAGNDRIHLDKGKQPIYASAEIKGGQGNDNIVGVLDGQNSIFGGENNDTIKGGQRDDLLYGEEGDDQLFGFAGNDKLDGGAGSDWLEAGSAEEIAEFGPNITGQDKDWNAHRWAINGATFDDIRQGTIGNCSFLAALSSLALRGVDLAGRIRYLGDFMYQVEIFDKKGKPAPQKVRFAGTGNSNDPNPAAPGEFWTILFRRAFLKAYRAIDDGLNPGVAVTTLTGRPSTFLKWAKDSSNDKVFDQMELDIRERRNVVTGTHMKGFFDLSLIAGHAYTVVGVQRDTAGKPGWVLVRNPWGYDGGSATYANPNDGLVKVSWEVFQRDMQGVWVN